MKAFIVLVISFCFVCAVAQKQDTILESKILPVIETSAVESQHSMLLDITKLGLGYMFEQKLGHQFTLNIYPHAGVLGWQAFTYMILHLSLEVETRWIYNRQKRLDKHKYITLNSGNFVGASLNYSYAFCVNYAPTEGQGLHFLSVPNLFWGIRRPLHEDLFFELQLGLGYLFILNKNYNIPLPNFSPSAYTFSSLKDDVKLYISFKLVGFRFAPSRKNRMPLE